jgi:hypothetical protein
VGEKIKNTREQLVTHSEFSAVRNGMVAITLYSQFLKTITFVRYEILLPLKINSMR